MRENKVAGFLGRRIRTLRKSKNLTQEQLGEESGINYKHLGAIERGEENPSLSALQKIAKGLGIEILELFRFQHEEPYELELGVSVTFHPGTGTDFVLGDYWLFDAEYWTEMSSVSTALNRFQVDYANGMVTFFPGDAGKTVYATYEGRGSLVKASDLTQIIDILVQGESCLRKIDTSGLTVRKLVGVNGSGVWVVAQPGPSGSIIPAVGFVKVVDADEGEIQLSGPMDGFSSLTPNTRLYLIADGGISTTPPATSGWIKQLVGRVLLSTRVLVKIDEDYTTNT